VLQPVADFGPNPGNLQMYEYVPAGLPSGRPLVVVLHGCTQGATDIEKAGWDDLADQVGFAVVYPQQQSANNALDCFNWAGENGDLADLTRGQGENESIKEMIDTAASSSGSDRARVYIAGFSAGGAFTAVMLATWPDLFAGGAIESGIPFDCAENLTDAYACEAISQHPNLEHTASEWAAKVHAADPAFTGTYPPVAIWQGTSDTTVDPANADELQKQWSGVGATIDVEKVTGMGHAVSMGASDPQGACSASGMYFEDHGLCSARRIAKFFGLTAAAAGPDAGPDAGPAASADAGAGEAGGRSGGCDLSPDAGLAVALALLGLRRRR
jgi:poly(hydroxyalkanoate) depolymerase family esterase